MIIYKDINLDEPLTTEQKQMLEILKTRPIEPDEDCPELTDFIENGYCKRKKISRVKKIAVSKPASIALCDTQCTD